MITTPDNPGDSVLMLWIMEHRNYDKDWCLIWPFGRARSGYGSYGRDDKALYVHRYMCEYANGAPPSPAHEAAHSCGRGHDGCVNPRHLSWKTSTENQLERTDSPGRRKLTPEQALEIRGLKGLEHVHLTAERFGITETNVRHIQAGKIWRRAVNGRRVFTDSEVIAIRSLRYVESSRAIAERYGVNPSVIARIQNSETYRYVETPISPQDR